ncbi:MAG: helix-turn-helix transcriptional regulator [Clostridiaceae bacterium]
MKNITLGDRIRNIRKRLKLNQADFALKIGLESPMAISSYENNQTEPDISKLIKISEIGNISLDELLTGKAPSKHLGVNNQSKTEDTSAPTPIYAPTALETLFSYDQKINIEEAIGKTYKVLSAGTALSVALYMNIQQFAAAQDTGQILQQCQDQMKVMQAQIDDLNTKVDRLTTPSTAERQDDGSEEKAM